MAFICRWLEKLHRTVSSILVITTVIKKVINIKRHPLTTTFHRTVLSIIGMVTKEVSWFPMANKYVKPDRYEVFIKV